MTAITNQRLLEVRSLTVDYLGERGKHVRACDDISFDLNRGEILGVAGESASGKSTLLTAILRLQRPPAVTVGGTVVYTRADGTRVDLTAANEKTIRPLRWADLSVVMQSAMACLNPVVRLEAQFSDVLAEHEPHLSKTERHDRAAKLLEMVGIPSHVLTKYPHEMSGGMRQRSLIALALACDPELIVMDEPTTAVDVVMQRQILDQILELQQQFGFAIIFVTHDLPLLMEIADRIAVMKDGKVVELASGEDIFLRPQHPYTQSLRDAFPAPSEASLTASEPAPDDATPVLEARGVTITFTGRDEHGRKHTVTACNNVSLSLGHGEIVALVGESGSGKTTLARALDLLQPIDSGEIRMDGRVIDARGPNKVEPLTYYGDVQMIFQDPFASLNTLKPLSHIIGRALKLHGKARTRAEVRQKTLDLLNLVKVSPAEEYIDRMPTSLSGGQMQRVSIARALAVEPKVLLADEPTSMLDVSIRVGVLDLLRELRDETGLAILYITHDITSARYLADRMAVMYRGDLVEEGETEQVITNPQHPYTRTLLGAVPDPNRRRRGATPDEKPASRVLATQEGERP